MANLAHTSEQIDEALALAWQYRSPTKAARELGLNPRTVNHWVNEAYPARYAEIGQELSRVITKELVYKFELSVLKSIDTFGELLNKMDDALESGTAQEACDWSRAAQDIAVSFSIAFDVGKKAKEEQAQAEALDAYDNRSIEEVIQSLSDMMPGLIVDHSEPAIDSTAEAA